MRWSALVPTAPNPLSPVSASSTTTALFSSTSMSSSASGSPTTVPSTVVSERNTCSTVQPSLHSGLCADNNRPAKPFDDVQKQVADLIKDRILVGHAVHNDLKVLLFPSLRHSTHPSTRSSSSPIPVHCCATLNITHTSSISQSPGASPSAPSPRTNSASPSRTVNTTASVSLALCCIFFLPIAQVADARATMNIYRLHRNTWEKPFPKRNHDGNTNQLHKRKRPTPQSAWWPDLP